MAAVEKWFEVFSEEISKTNKVYLAGENWAGALLPKAADMIAQTIKPVSGIILINADVDDQYTLKFSAKYDLLWGY